MVRVPTPLTVRFESNIRADMYGRAILVSNRDRPAFLEFADARYLAGQFVFPVP